MKRLLIFTLLIFGYVSISAQMRTIEFTEYDMDNGMHVILHQDNSTPIVAITLTFHVGSKNEKADRTGFAHYMEHLMFEGSKYMKRGEYDILCQGAGGANNAYTSQDETAYYQILPSNQLELGLWMESERLLHLVIDSVGVETQRSVVKEERKQRYDNQPYGSLWEETFKRAFKKHPYNWTPIGSAQYIDQATLEEFMEFHSHYYVPNNVTLSIAGDITFDQAKEWIEKYFGDIPKGEEEIIRPNIVEPEQTEEIRDVVYDNIRLPLVMEAYHMPEQGTDDYYALEMLSTLLSGGQSSRLSKALIDDQQIALQVNASPYAMEDPGIFYFLAVAKMGVSAEDLEASLEKEVDKVRSELISEVEFTKLRNQVENAFVSSNSTVLGIALSLASYHVFFDDANLINKEIERYMKVTREDIKRVAQKYFTKSNRVVLYYLPKEMQGS